MLQKDNQQNDRDTNIFIQSNVMSKYKKRNEEPKIENDIADFLPVDFLTNFKRPDKNLTLEQKNQRYKIFFYADKIIDEKGNLIIY